jgi:hypothetical protein
VVVATPDDAVRMHNYNISVLIGQCVFSFGNVYVRNLRCISTFQFIGQCVYIN